MTDNEAVQMAKEIASDGNNGRIRVLANGTRVRLVPVSTALLDEVSTRIKDPEIPMWHNEQKDRDEPNPSDPRYVRALEENTRKRGIAVMDALVMFGVELLDGVPEEREWLKKLKFMEKRDQISLEGYDLEDPFDVEFLYKRYIATDNDMLTTIGQISAITQEDIERAQDSFQGRKKRN